MVKIVISLILGAVLTTRQTLRVISHILLLALALSRPNASLLPTFNLLEAHEKDI